MKRLFKKPGIIGFICLLSCVILIGLFCWYTVSNQYTVTSEPVVVSEIGDHPANNRQIDASVRLFVWNNKLYFFSYHDTNKAQYMRELCAFENNSVVSYGKMYMLYALENGFAYFDAKKEFGTPREYELMCMNLATGDVEYLETIPSFAWSGIIYSADGTCYIPKDDRPGEPIVEYYIAKDATLSEPVEMAERYMLGSNQYAIEKGDLIRYDEAGNREVVKDYVELGFHCLIPCESGLLVFRHGSSYVLDYIPEDTQTVVELFHYRGFASNAGVNIHDNYVYISCEMFDKLGEKGTEKGSAAPFDGTYRISLTDYTVEKLNDVFYDGLYIYDDTGIYATKVGCIYKLDFDGNVIMTLME